MVVVFFLHLAFFAIMGNYLKIPPTKEIRLFNVSMVKPLKRNKKEKKKSRIKWGKNHKGYRSKRKVSKRPGPDRKSKKPPGPKKPKPPSDAKPPVGQNAAPNVPVKIELPKSNYKRRDPRAEKLAFKRPVYSHKDGVPSGKTYGILGSKGTDGDIKGIGGGDGIEAGGEGGGGLGGGLGERWRPTVSWLHEGFGWDGEPNDLDGMKRDYFKRSDCSPLLVHATGPPNDSVWINLGTGRMDLEMTIPAVDEVPDLGIHPINIKIVGMKLRDKSKADRFARVAISSARHSGWFPAKKDGKSINYRMSVSLVFHGKFEPVK